MTNKIGLLNDQQMTEFIRNGYIKLRPNYRTELNQKIYTEIESMFNLTGNLGNNILPLIPEIQEIFSHPLVDGALTSILGSGYVMHSHRFCHLTPPNSNGQNFHRDSYEGDIDANNHRCRWAMAFYYPQDTPRLIGPTSILPGSQYYETDQAANQQTELPLSGKAGALTIVHYDLWHRAMANFGSHNRYMLKFLFYRLEEPDNPTWQNEQNDWPHLAENEILDSRNQLMWQKIWQWYIGETSPQTSNLSATNLTKLLNQLSDKSEENRLAAAYTLGAMGEKAVPSLADQLSRKLTVPYVVLALGSGDETAIPVLTSALSHSDDTVRSQAAHALGDLGYPSAANSLTNSLSDVAPKVRRNAAEAIGNLNSRTLTSEDQEFTQEQALALGQLLHDDHYWVRDNAARGLAKMGYAAEPAIFDLGLALNDQNRYVRFNAALALKQVGTPSAHEMLLDHLFVSRWCPLTTKHSSF